MFSAFGACQVFTLGLRLSPDAQSLGFALFIFSVGYQAGPRFFDVLRTDGLKYFFLAAVIAVTGSVIAILAGKQIDVPPGTAAGILAGGLTSSPTLAAAQEAIRAGSVAPPEGWSADAVIGNITTGYAITYIFGLAGLIAIIKLLPGILGIDLAQEAKKMEAEEGLAEAPPTSVSIRTFRVTNTEMTSRSKRELIDELWDGFSVIVRLRDGEVLERDLDDPLRIGDELIVLGASEYFTKGIQRVGEEIPTNPEHARIDSARVVVINPDAVGKHLAEIGLALNYSTLLLHVHRSGMELPTGLDLELHKGDVLTVSGPAAGIDRLGQVLGHVERDVPETDMITFATGIAVGVVVGLLSIQIGGISIGLGSAGGLVAAGIVIGFLRSVYPTFGRLPEAVRWIFMEFGLLLFMAGVGLRAGGDIVETFLQAGPKLMIAGILVTTVPVLLGYLYGRKVLGLNPVLLLGGITGSMTSGASLSIVTKAAQSSVPALGYTGAYAFANVLLTIAGSLILIFD
ncbi:MAG: TrkA C-terminal domain-containing protein [Desulfobacterales bacterium]